MTPARRFCVIRQAVAGLLVAALMVAVGLAPVTDARAELPAAAADAPPNPDTIAAMLVEMRAMREDFRDAMSDGRKFLQVAGGWVGGVATILMVDGSGRVRKAVSRRISQESKQ